MGCQSSIPVVNAAKAEEQTSSDYYDEVQCVITAKAEEKTCSDYVDVQPIIVHDRLAVLSARKRDKKFRRMAEVSDRLARSQQVSDMQDDRSVFHLAPENPRDLATIIFIFLSQCR